ncbi:MAG: hypothetical protein C0597_08265, partial [Marinilabiliales bacterium]
MSSAQTIDTVLVDSVIIEIYEKDFNEQNDTLLNDSELYFENQSDSIFRKDSIHSIQINDTVTSELTKNVYSQDSVPVIKTYEEVLEIIKDSLYFEDPDTLHYVIYNLKNLMSSDSIVLKDSTKQAIQKLIQYSTTRKIDTVISYLKKHLELAFEKEYQDSSLKVYNDSIFAAVKFLIESIPQDSVKLSFTNLINDSVLFEVAENEVDSVRINLYDNRGEYATLWIIKSDKSVFDIYLEDGIY